MLNCSAWDADLGRGFHNSLFTPISPSSLGPSRSITYPMDTAAADLVPLGAGSSRMNMSPTRASHMEKPTIRSLGTEERHKFSKAWERKLPMLISTCMGRC